MKKLFITLFAIMACMLLITGCDTAKNPQNKETESQTVTETETEKKNEIVAKCVVKKGKRYVIVLPESNYSLPVEKEFVKYLPYVTDELVAAAEKKITEDAASLGETSPNWTIKAYEDDKMCLVVEVIKFVEGADYMEEGGCGIDHEHIFFAESIINEQ